MKRKIMYSYDAYRHEYIAPLYRFGSFETSEKDPARIIERARRETGSYELASVWVVDGPSLL